MTPYTDPRWKALRLAVLARDRYRCQIALSNCKGIANQVDHVVDWRDGGPALDAANLRAACRSCNVAQRNQRVAARARAHREAMTAPTTSREW